jgi:hypothetical protein
MRKILVVMSVGKMPFEDIEVDWKLKLKWIIDQAIHEAVGSVYLGRAWFSSILNTSNI